MKALAALLSAGLLCGCGPAYVQAPPAIESYNPTPASVELTTEAPPQDLAREFTYRVRNPSCSGVGTGSAFAFSKNLLITNRHVVDGGLFSLELTTWDGKDYSTEVSVMSTWADLALIYTKQPLPAIANLGVDPQAGDSVAVVGYPGGGPISTSTGKVVDYVSGAVYGLAHDVVRIDAKVRPGNSGGPLLDSNGNVVGVVFALEKGGKRYGLAIPVSTLQSQIRQGALQSTPSC